MEVLLNVREDGENHMNNSIKIPKQELFDADLPWEYEFKEIIGTRRWSIDNRIVFKWKDGKYYETFFSEPATEMQDERPWEGEKEVECWEVEFKEVVKKEWVRV